MNQIAAGARRTNNRENIDCSMCVPILARPDLTYLLCEIIRMNNTAFPCHEPDADSTLAGSERRIREFTTCFITFGRAGRRNCCEIISTR